MKKILNFARQLAVEAGELMVDERNSAPLTHDYKNGSELVTQADLKVDRLICERIKDHYPNHAILSEESSPDMHRVWELPQPVWIIDPIDGRVRGFLVQQSCPC